MTKLPTLFKNSKPLGVSPLQLYLREIAKHPLLSPEEELKLAKKHHESGDVEAAHRLVTSNLRLVVKIAMEFRQAQVGLLDLIQEGNFGLMQAVKKFDPHKGVKLSSYAVWWIRAYILKYLMDNRGQVKVATTASQRKLFYNLEKETQKLLQKGEAATPGQIAVSLSVPEKEVLEMQKRLHAKDVPLDASLGESGQQDRHLVDLLFKTQEHSVEEELASAQLKELFFQHLKDFQKKLNPRDEKIFSARFLEEKPSTLQCLGKELGVTRERVRQLEKNILSRLKGFARERGLVTD